MYFSNPPLRIISCINPGKACALVDLSAGDILYLAFRKVNLKLIAGLYLFNCFGQIQVSEARC